MADHTPRSAPEIAAVLHAHHWVIVERGGVQYTVSYDEAVTGLYAWLHPVDENDSAMGGSFGEPEGDEADDYTEVAEAIARWLAEIP